VFFFYEEKDLKSAVKLLEGTTKIKRAIQKVSSTESLSKVKNGQTSMKTTHMNETKIKFKKKVNKNNEKSNTESFFNNKHE
jgi:hypothetical protein